MKHKDQLVQLIIAVQRGDIVLLRDYFEIPELQATEVCSDWAAALSFCAWAVPSGIPTNAFAPPQNELEQKIRAYNFLAGSLSKLLADVLEIKQHSSPLEPISN